MAARKRATAVPAPNAHVRLVTHTGRMLAVLADKSRVRPATKADYEPIIAGYKARWAALSPAERKAAIKAATGFADMDAKTVKAAVAALEG